MDIERDIDILLIGKTGNGKSAVGNSILGRNHFATSFSTSSETQSFKWGTLAMNGKKIKVVDGPGVGDTRLDTNESKKLLSRALEISPRGYHVFLFVVRYGSRFTDEEGDILRELKSIFWDNVVSDHCIVVVTFGDHFRSENKSHETFEEWCSHQGGSFRELLSECRGRAVLFDNYAEGEQHESQRDKLFATLEKMKSGRCTKGIFKATASFLTLASDKIKTQCVEEEVVKQLAVFCQELNEVIYCCLAGDLNQSTRLSEITAKLDAMIREIKAEDRSTGVLKDLESRVQDMKNAIRDTLTMVSCIRQEKEMTQLRLQQIHEMQESLKTAEASLLETVKAREAAERKTSAMNKIFRQEQEHMGTLENMKIKVRRTQKAVEDILIQSKSEGHWDKVVERRSGIINYPGTS